MNALEEIIGTEEAQDLRHDFDQLLNQNASYHDFEDLLSMYGLEPDYLECLIY